jgi:hypothetical protein
VAEREETCLQMHKAEEWHPAERECSMVFFAQSKP